MSYSDQRGGYPPPPDHRESEYPPPSVEEDDRATAYHQRGQSANSSVTLPSISPYDPQYAQPNGYAVDPRAYQQDPYRSPPQAGPYRDDRAYQPDFGRGAPPPQQIPPYQQSAPRQRTAIACRYCRRRKIRCSGFDQSVEGRCSNCQRFQQECIFTPVSSQAQAFVPAHALYPNMRNMGVGPDGRPRPMAPPGTQLYGAHGQPLGQVPPQPAGGSPYYDYSQSSPTSSYSPYPDDRRAQDPNVLPPPASGQPPFGRSDSAGRRQGEEGVNLPPVTPTGGQTAANYSPGSSTSSHSNRLAPQQQGPTMSRTPPPARSSPGDGRADPMSLGNIMERQPDAEIDRSMLGRLDRRGQ